MADTTHDIGTLTFAAAIILMVICAGVASLPPARDSRVFVGAAVIFGAWLLVVIFIQETGSRLVTSTLVLLDVLYAIVFYLLSRPAAGEPSGAVYQRNWAAYVCAVFAPVIFLEFINILYRFEGWFSTPAAVVLSLSFGVISFGFARGFGLKALSIFTVAVAFIVVAAAISYVRTVNFLTLMIIVIITFAAARGARTNVTAWVRRIKAILNKRRSDGDHRLAPAPRRNALKKLGRIDATGASSRRRSVRAFRAAASRR